ncbi:radical SAM/SPASM domain-containing protein [Methanoculleus oceani]|uniref:Radical SAM/SPASM domain-containing protein n=1 Tax=Methanoculleus oceani TaxID=2184756 RepID=A0ABD4TID3_9EURY|nr:radical SAM protein [Methanoculleus sp. CWC-02]MCM2466896.1 radical SAM/SPASM domain-containing protein [Methanoculleus sp. CWC-02]
MNRITRYIHAKGTVSEVLRHRAGERTPSGMLAFSDIRRPVVFWNITNRCNLLCSHCYIRAGPGQQRGNELTTEEALDLIDDLAAMRVPLLLFSGGEPLIREDFWELAGHAKDRGLTTALSTNGTLITPAAARRLRDAGVEYAGVSLDGATARTHDGMRNVPGSFDLAVSALKNCRSAGLKCGVRVTATRENRTEIPALIDLSQDVGAERFCVYWLVPSGRGSEGYDALQLRSHEVVDLLDLLIKRAHDVDPSAMEFLTVDAPQDAVYLLERLQEENPPVYENMCTLLARSGVGCSAGDRIANIDPSGDVYPCQFAQVDELKVGSIREKPFSAIWNDSKNRILADFRRKKDLVGGSCGRCSYRDRCGGGCRVRAFADTGDLWAEDPLCPIRREEPRGRP